MDDPSAAVHVSNNNEGRGEHFTRLFSDISKSVSGGLRSFLAADPAHSSSGSAEEPMSLASLFTGSNCIRTCGMEDMQYAARKAAELFVALRVCCIVLTILLALYLILLFALRLHKWRMSHHHKHRFEGTGQKGMSQFLSASRTTSNSTNTSSDSGREPMAELKSKLSSASTVVFNPNADAQSQHSITAATPMPLPPPSICTAHPQSGEPLHERTACERNVCNNSNGNYYFNSQHNGQFSSLSDYLMAKRIATNGN